MLPKNQRGPSKVIVSNAGIDLKMVVSNRIFCFLQSWKGFPFCPLRPVMVPPAGNVESSASAMRNSPIAPQGGRQQENMPKTLNSHTYHLSPEHIIIYNYNNYTINTYHRKVYVIISPTFFSWNLFQAFRIFGFNPSPLVVSRHPHLMIQLMVDWWFGLVVFTIGLMIMVGKKYLFT